MKYKIGQRVVTHKFGDTQSLGFSKGMEKLVGEVGEITNYVIYKNQYEVHGYIWPESALTPAPDEPIKEVEEKPEQPRKTLGDFMLAALTGLCAVQSIIDNPSERVADVAFRTAKAAFEIYEKEA